VVQDLPYGIKEISCAGNRDVQVRGPGKTGLLRNCLLLDIDHIGLCFESLPENREEA